MRAPLSLVAAELPQEAVEALEDKKRKEEIDFLKYQGQHLDQFLRQLGPAAK